MKYCLLIPSYHQGEKTEWLLKQLIQSIKEYEPGLIPHTMILDDASPVTPHKFYHSLGVNYHVKKQNTSYSANINKGLELATKCGYDVAVTLNNDIILRSPIQSVPLVADVTGALLYYPSGKIQHQGFSIFPDGYCDMHEIGEIFPTRASGYMFGVTGAFQVIRLPSLKYDERYTLAYEDVEFCYRNWINGKTVFYDTRLIAIHQESATRGNQLGKKELRSLQVYLSDVKSWDLSEVSRRVSSLNLCQRQPTNEQK